MYLYNFMSDDNVFAEEIETNGFSGYEIDATYAESYPDMTWNGITFGADGDAVVAAYGDADYVYECELYSAYTYSIFDDVELEFYVYPFDYLSR